MKKIIFVAPFEDRQTGEYVFYSLNKGKHHVAPFDVRKHLKKLGREKTNQKLIYDVKRLEPDLVLILKGLEIDIETIKKIKKVSKVATWIFDVTLSGIPLELDSNYVEYMKENDYFFSFCKGNIEKLRSLGINAHYIREGYHPGYYEEIPVNAFEKRKFGSDVVFIGSIGSKDYHTERVPLLQYLIERGVDMKIYGDIFKDGNVTPEILDKHTKYKVINDYHSIVVSSSKVNLGIDGWPDVELSQSARMYRVMASGGFYLTSYVKGLEKIFKIGEELDVYHNKEECLEKIKYYLEHDEEREKIAKAGMKKIQETNNFENITEELLDKIFKEDKNE